MRRVAKDRLKMKHILLFLVPIVALATTVREPVQYEMQQIAGAVTQYLLKHPDAAAADSRRIAHLITGEHPEGVYLRFDGRRLNADGLLATNGKPYLILVAREGVCVLRPDDNGDYNSKEARHYFFRTEPSKIKGARAAEIAPPSSKPSP